MRKRKSEVESRRSFFKGVKEDITFTWNCPRGRATTLFCSRNMKGWVSGGGFPVCVEEKSEAFTQNRRGEGIYASGKEKHPF